MNQERKLTQFDILKMQNETNQSFPKNFDAEQTLIGAMLTNPDNILEVIDYLSPDDFWDNRNRIIFETIAGLYEDGVEVNLITVSDKLTKIKILQEVGGLSYMTASINLGALTQHPVTLAKIIKEKSNLRKIIISSNKIINLAYDEKNQDITKHILDIEQNASRLNDRSISRKVSVGDLIPKLEEEIINFAEGKNKIISTGFELLDKVIEGFIVPHIWIIGGYTGVGKTFFTLNVLINLMRGGLKPVIFSTENNAARNILRLLGCMTGFSEMKLYRGNFTPEEKEQIDKAKEELKSFNLIVYDSVFDTADIRLKAKKHKIKNGSNLIVIDYIQNLNRSMGEIYKQMNMVSMDLQRIAIELEMGVIGVSQVSNAEVNKEESSTLTFKGAGEISAIADVAIWLRRHTEEKTKMAAIIKKVRYGMPGRVMFDFFTKDENNKIINYLQESSDQNFSGRRSTR